MQSCLGGGGGRKKKKKIEKESMFRNRESTICRTLKNFSDHHDSLTNSGFLRSQILKFSASLWHV